MKKYIENQTISLFVAEDGSFRLITEDSDEVLSSEYPKAIAAYFTARMNEALSKGFSAEDFTDDSEVTEKHAEDPLECASGDSPTLEMQEMEKDFDRIKRLAFQKADMSDSAEQYDVKAYQNMLLTYELHRQKLYDTDQARRYTMITKNAYITERKAAQSIKKMYFSVQSAIKKTSEKLTHLIKNADKMSKDELIDELLDIVSLAIGEEVTAKQIRKKLKGSVDD